MRVFKSSVAIFRTISQGRLNSSSIIRTVKWRSRHNDCRTLWIFAVVQFVTGVPQRCSSSKLLQPSRKSLNHWNNVLRESALSSHTFHSISWASVAHLSNLKQNFQIDTLLHDAMHWQLLLCSYRMNKHHREILKTKCKLLSDVKELIAHMSAWEGYSYFWKEGVLPSLSISSCILYV